MKHSRRTTPTSKRPSIGEVFRSLSTSSIARPQAPSFRSWQPSLSPVTSDFVSAPSDTTSDNRINHPSNSDHSHHNPVPSSPQPELSLRESLALLSRAVTAYSAAPKSKSANKPRIPDVFDGANPRELDTFIFQCSMYFAACSDDFPDDESRVSFVLSYLSDTPLDWFHTELNHAVSYGENLPPWFSSLPHFLAELRRLFGPRDALNDAVTALESLRYQDSTKAARYTLEFNRHSCRTGWNENALVHHYYSGLCARLKDEIARIGKPARLADLQDLVTALDQRHWERYLERQSEIVTALSRSTSASPPLVEISSPIHSRSRSASPAPSETPSDCSGSQDTHYSDAVEHPHSENNSPMDISPPATSPAPAITWLTDLLGPDGKLKPEERHHRLENGLCLRCGESGHFVSDCPL
jgi:hypothetical protein